MPAGAKKRKAAKKKMKKGEAHNSNINNSSNSSSTHSQGSDEVRSVDDRESDGGEILREEEEEKGQAAAEEETTVDREEEIGEINGDDILQADQTVEIEKESKPHEGNPVEGADPSDGAELVRSGISAAAAEDQVPRNGVTQEKEVKVEEEEDVVTAESEKEPSWQEEYKSLLEAATEAKTVKPADYLPEEAIAAAGAISEQVHNLLEERNSIEESVKEELLLSPLAYLTTQIAPGEGSAKSESIGSDFKSNEEASLLSSHEEKLSPAAVDSQVEKTETKVVPVENETFDKPSSIGKENEDNLPNSVGSPAVDSSSGEVDNVKDLASHQKSEEKIVAPPVETSRDVEYVNNTETVKHSDEALVVNTSRGMNNGKDLNNSNHTEDQALIGSTQIPVRRTSWTGCCGLFEVFSGSR